MSPRKKKIARGWNRRRKTRALHDPESRLWVDGIFATDGSPGTGRKLGPWRPWKRAKRLVGDTPRKHVTRKQWRRTRAA
jgi:hypothetical protein